VSDCREIMDSTEQAKASLELCREWKQFVATEALEYCLGKINHQQKEIDKLQADLALAREGLHKYAYLIQYIYDTCLCERFKTKGFDYHENHPKRDKGNGGSRPATPIDKIEQIIGFEWKYEKPEGVCKSWKELKFETLAQLDKKEGE